MENNDLDQIVERIKKNTDKFIEEHEAFNKKANKQASKRARVLTNKLTKQLKLYRKESIKIVNKIKK